MNALANLQTQTMSSKDLLEIINAVRAEFNEPIIRLNKFNEKIEDELEGEYYTKSVVQNLNNTASVIYHLTIDQCTLISMRESKGVRKNVLAKLKSLAVPQTFADALQLAADQAKQLELAQSQIQVLGPKAQALDVIANTDGTYNIRECAKTIGIPERKLIALLIDKKWCYREGKKLQPYADKVSSGVFINRPSSVITNQYTGEEKVHLHMRVTAFGLTRITGLVGKMGVI
ncbi:phage antirepressor KilAC domain-containing protein [Acinetobacter rudis]|uniref:phage antirepressor KilAC domain-containing protein n=1 Tax=Acinetobacter rudis TaxID=632955 RepID=UPI00333F4686